MARVKVFEQLPEEAVMIRTKVFMEEQGFKNEFDLSDDRAVHLVLFENKVPVGTCRIFKEEDHYAIGRLAVLKSGRGKGFAKQLVSEAQKEITKLGGTKILIHAQKRLEKMYERFGFRSCGIEDRDEGVPHVWMQNE